MARQRYPHGYVGKCRCNPSVQHSGRISKLRPHDAADRHAVCMKAEKAQTEKLVEWNRLKKVVGFFECEWGQESILPFTLRRVDEHPGDRLIAHSLVKRQPLRGRLQDRPLHAMLFACLL